VHITSHEIDGPFTGQNCVGGFSGTMHAVKSR